VAASFVCCSTYGTFYTFGIFFRPLQVEFGWSYTLTSSIQCVHLMFYGLSSFAVGWASDHFGPRRPLLICGALIGVGYVLCGTIQSIRELFLFYSLTSVGAGVVWSLPLSTVQRWFIEKRGLALGVTVSGIGVGTFAWFPFVNYLIYDHGWRTAYTCMGIITMSALFLAAMVMDFPERMGAIQSLRHLDAHETSPGPFSAKTPSGEIFRSPDLWLISLFQFFFNVGLFFIFVHLVPLSIQVGISKTAGAAALRLMGGMSVLGRIVTPVTIERKMGARWDRGLIGCAVGSAVMLLWLT
jgi:MFS transporter, OFA family, oxalate/formate antiporter